MTTKMDDSSFRLEGTGFGYIYYDNIRYVVEKAYVKSPSDHKIEGSFLHAELQVQAVAGNNRLVLTKLLQEVPKVLDGYQAGLSQFGFGRNICKYLKPKLSAKQESDLMAAGRGNQIPTASYQPRNSASLNTFFIQDTKWMMYEGNETFDRCMKTRWLISFDPAAISTDELHDFKMRDYSLFNPIEVFAREKRGITLFKNKDRPPGFKSKRHRKKPKKP
jgi:hypothetical protein